MRCRSASPTTCQCSWQKLKLRRKTRFLLADSLQTAEAEVNRKCPKIGKIGIKQTAKVGISKEDLQTEAETFAVEPDEEEISRGGKINKIRADHESTVSYAMRKISRTPVITSKNATS